MKRKKRKNEREDRMDFLFERFKELYHATCSFGMNEFLFPRAWGHVFFVSRLGNISQKELEWAISEERQLIHLAKVYTNFDYHCKRMEKNLDYKLYMQLIRNKADALGDF